MRQKTQTYEFGRKALIKVFFSCCLALNVGTVYCSTQGAGHEVNLSQRPAQSLPESETNESHNSNVSEPPASQDFLSDTSPLSAPTLESTEKATELLLSVDKKGEQCSSSGSAAQGSETCLNKQGDGGFIESTSNWEDFGDEKKIQTIRESYNPEGGLIEAQTTRVKIESVTLSNGKSQKEKEFFDIVRQPVKGAITRELIVKEFDKKGLLSKITWAHYREIGSRKAGLAHHAVLYYQNGKLDAGFANEYKNGKVSDVLLNFDKVKTPHLRIELTGASLWLQQIDNLTHHSPRTAN